MRNSGISCCSFSIHLRCCSAARRSLSLPWWFVALRRAKYQSSLCTLVNANR